MRVFLLTNLELSRLATDLHDRHGKPKPKHPSAHIRAVAEALLRHIDSGRDVASFEQGVEKMRAVVDRPLFAHEWSHAWLYRDLEIVPVPEA